MSTVRQELQNTRRSIQCINIVLFTLRQGPFSVVLVKRPSRHRRNLRYTKGCTQIKGLSVAPFAKSLLRQQVRLTDHRRSHSDIRPFKCSLCDSYFKSAYKLQRHLNTVHSEIRPFKCPHCEKAFKQSDQLKRHSFTHSEDLQYKCSECTMSFTSAGNLRQQSLVQC